MTEPTTRLSPVDPTADALFVYGTLRFGRILAALLGRVPSTTPAATTGWRTAALARRPYPGLVPAPGQTASGLLLSGLSAREWRALDDFEDDEYELVPLMVDSGARGLPGPGTVWSYTWAAPGEVLPENWEADAFAERQLDRYAARLEGF
ncbi:gamma-glutamylcyclotransferase family protein [Streptomyces spirodelae]|uniref:Putative gamma-glutamylcyclotransferase n=1 Tax=Streptomyces spirodelae TaxID=2812904 RepID=A0ABS3WMT5_9ACTN|nr:gamma-glutamylcyclotransferase family protein [Streptomyces spirodelae]MBO8184427.1 gamma-glutamylcyclotransferase [Streptomyces spirodelae]